MWAWQNQILDTFLLTDGVIGLSKGHTLATVLRGAEAAPQPLFHISNRNGEHNTDTYTFQTLEFYFSLSILVLKLGRAQKFSAHLHQRKKMLFHRRQHLEK